MVQILRGSDNYIPWKEELICFLRQKGLAHILHSKSSPTAATCSHQKEQDTNAARSDADDDDLLIKQDRVMAFIEYSVSPLILRQIERITDPQLALETLESLYKPSSRELWLEASIRLSTIQYHPHITLVEHFSQLEECFQTIEANGSGIDDNLKVMYLWRSLRPYFKEKYKQYIKTVVFKNQTYLDVKKGLLDDEVRRRGILPSITPTALPARRTRFRPPSAEIHCGKNCYFNLKIGSHYTGSTQVECYRCGKTGHYRNQCHLSSNIQCNVCGKTGHNARICRCRPSHSRRRPTTLQ